MSRTEAVEVAGLEAADWMRMYAHTHNGLERVAWPDGGCYLEQLQIVVEIWELIANEIRSVQREQRH